MSSTPGWVKQLKPSGPQGSELLAAERASSNLPVEQLSELLFTKEGLARKNKVLSVLKSEKLFDKTPNYYLGRTEHFQSAVRRAKALRNLRVKNNWTLEEYRLANELISEPLPYSLHDGMFVVTLSEQGTPEQQKLFTKPAEDYKIIGCYAQTELGHGSNVRGLETTATWNPQDKTFIIHSPHLTASKWWIGSLGKMATHACVMAQLIINGKSYGPHPFIVQIRDMKTHEPLENIHVGDVGPKFGYNTMDNGFLLFNHVKVPHVNMLARFSRVDPETNTYVPNPVPTLVYGTMTWVRSTIVMQAGSALARGVTIATRYCAVRRQFQDRDAPASAKETAVLNYKMVQARLFPLLAATYALHFTGKAMMDMYSENQKQGGTGILADLHASSCALKALSSTIAVDGLEACRRACGGHGFSSFSGIGQYYGNYLPTVTFEGDNYMLTQQVANYLLKSARDVLAGKPAKNETTRILSEFRSRAETGCAFDVIGSDADIVAAYAWRASSLAFDAQHKRETLKTPWNDLLVDFYRLNKSFAQYMVVKNFYETVQAEAKRGQVSRDAVAILRALFRLYALWTLDQEASEFTGTGACSERQVALIRVTVEQKLLAEIRPHAVRLVDAWAFDDWVLDSSLGRYDGKVYEDMFCRASELNPLNRIVVDPNPNSDVIFRKIEGQDPRSKL
ncbi:acyl-CoA oxidase [Westerdykella ornata]|uniref:Acyl-coenzyme A oxidase n=1 Tax=Westerdykella ornata TaxID=318751 RepID=A0A6A6JZQ5_WESOR|nr:acyl-CoA oxidase [Westerdykella ornata]KAF2280559.1 acyl-CoA oxidase [Westerdykella ornata]